jgi:hypothetical protein
MADEAKCWPPLCADSARTVVAEFIIFRWGLVDVIIGVAWLATNGRYKATKALKPHLRYLGAVAIGYYLQATLL